MGTLLVTGGAGYIGSHVVKRLGELGYRLVVLDNLSTGHAASVLYGELVVGDTGDSDLVRRTLKDFRVDGVLHFAAHVVVPESVEDPLKYYGNNTANTRTLLEGCVAAGVSKFIFSSTAAVYGTPKGGVASEDTPTAPINPYGWSKLMSEQMLRDLDAASALRHVALRYFNVAGADPMGRIGQSTPKATHLIKAVAEAAVGKRAGVQIFGTDYPTPDGTGVRDYIHVEDLASAHIQALRHLENEGRSLTLNCGYGHGASVREVIDAVQRMGNVSIDVQEAHRRAGDPGTLIAAADAIREMLGWEPEFDDLDTIVKHALSWEKTLLEADHRTDVAD